MDELALLKQLTILASRISINRSPWQLGFAKMIDICEAVDEETRRRDLLSVIDLLIKDCNSSLVQKLIYYVTNKINDPNDSRPPIRTDVILAKQTLRLHETVTNLDQAKQYYHELIAASQLLDSLS